MGSIIGEYLTLSGSYYLLRSSLVSRHTRTKGRVVESAGILIYRKRSGPDRWNNHPWSGSGGGRQGTDPLPALGRTRPWFLRCNV